MDDAEDREDRATLTGRAYAEEPADNDQPDRAGFAAAPVDGGQPERSDVADEEPDVDADEVIVAEVVAATADDHAAGDQESIALVDAAGAGPPDAHPDTAAAEVVPADGDAEDAAAPSDAAGPGGDARDNGMVGDPEQLHRRWSVIQASFVDDPRGSVTAAAALVTETISTLVATAQERERGLRGEWDTEGIDTEGLRNALRSYRRFLDQLAAR